MLTTIAIVDRLNDWKGWSDYRVAQMLEVTHQTVSKWRKKGAIMSNETAVKAAEILGLPEEFILAGIELERSLNSTSEAAQQSILDMVAEYKKDEIEAAEKAMAKDKERAA
ncbi:helix-turn-helix transcriptional regulator [Pseudomaricurvus alkylphenolicus]|uniref:helix-turn-helix domain-containing protein n=1 Tax=Pseudomaricurvus alkylphenolicus TaxID=1306991 RepID=UPI00141E7F14|nr:helix-turn-helix transcriptional regulator [Pseudomaricurvus alkylphenolicus]NIB44735.1 helix-turn-helix transcriptional regulator [Pseudomaricurvus alkylphenolicus]